MNNSNRPYPPPYYLNTPEFRFNSTYDNYGMYQNTYNPYGVTMPFNNPNMMQNQNTNPLRLVDYGPNPFTINIERATEQNQNFRTALWTGNHLQLTLMSLNVGEDIGLEMHPNTDQFIRIEEGQGLVKMGDSMDRLDFQAYVSEDFAIVIPAGKWHNLINVGNRPIKLYSIYAPPQHPRGTVHRTKEDAEAAEHTQHRYY